VKDENHEESNLEGLLADITSRALKALANVYVDDKSLDVMLKFITIWNLLKKMFKIPLTVWPFRDCVARCNFESNEYDFLLANGFDFNIYLNPFFHEYDITRFVSLSLNEGDVFMDVGAHAGLYTLIASSKVGLQGKVLSFEPNPLNFFFLKQNVELNRLNNVLLIPKAVSEKPGKLRLYYSPHNTALSSALDMEGREKKIDVESIRIDDAASEYGLNLVKIVKVDTEGCDLNVLKCSTITLSRTLHVIVEQNTSNVRKFLSDHGFQLSTFNPSGYLLGTNKNLRYCTN